MAEYKENKIIDEMWEKFGNIPKIELINLWNVAQKELFEKLSNGEVIPQTNKKEIKDKFLDLYTVYGDTSN